MGDFHRALLDMSTAMQIDEQNGVSKRDLAEHHNFCVILHYELGAMEEASIYADMATKNDASNG